MKAFGIAAILAAFLFTAGSVWAAADNRTGQNEQQHTMTADEHSKMQHYVTEQEMKPPQPEEGHSHGEPAVESPPNYKVLGAFAGANAGFLLFGAGVKLLNKKGRAAA